MDAQEISLLSPVLQVGAFGLCLVLIAVLWWLLRKLLDVLVGNTSALEGLSGLVSDVKEASQDVRDRMLEFDCPFRGGEHQEKQR